MKLKIGKRIKVPKNLNIKVMKETGTHQYQFFGREGFLGRSPCRSSVKKLTPEAVMSRAEICPSEYWRNCNLVDTKGNVLDTMTFGKAYGGLQRNIYNKITITPKKIPHLGEISY